jgi:hypothetical protein
LNRLLLQSILAAVFLPTGVWAQAPVLSKQFSQSPVLVGQSTPLTFTITNQQIAGIGGIGFTDILPAALVVATPNGLSGGCGGGTVTAVAASNMVSLSGASLNGNASCTFSVNVVATATGSFLNTTSTLTSSIGAGNMASDTLVVAPARTPLPPIISKFFALSAIAPHQVTRLNFILTNPNASLALTGVGFSDTLPAGVVVATPNGLSGDCGGGTISANAGASLISLSGATLTANAMCSFSVNTVAASTGSYLNTTSVVTSTEGGTGNAARTALLVMSTIAPVLSKQFGQSPVLVGQSTPLTFTITNQQIAGFGGIGFTDTLPAGLVVATPNGLSGGCGGGTITAVAASNMVSLSGASLNGNASCTFSVNVVATATGSFLNTTSTLTSSIGAGNMASDTLVVVPLRAPVISKTFGAMIIQTNAVVNLTFTILNTNPTVLLTGLGFSDSLPAGLTVTTGSGATCGGKLTLTGTPTDNITLSGGTLMPGTSCTFTVPVTATTPGTRNNTTTPITSNEAGNGNTASASVTVFSPPTLTKAFGDSQIEFLFGSTILSFTISNSADNPASLTDIAFSDTLPGGLTVALPNNGLNGSCGGGTITAVAGSNSISLSAASLAPGASCTFSVVVSGTGIGVQTNMTSTITADAGALSGSPATAIVSVVGQEFLWFFMEGGGGGRP